MAPEQRQAVRVAIDSGVEAYIYDSRQDKKKIFLQDISITGMRFTGCDICEVNSLAQFQVNIPELPHPLLFCGRVVWQKPLTDNRFESGVEFKMMDRAQLDVLTDYIRARAGSVQERRRQVRRQFASTVSFRDVNTNEQGVFQSADLSGGGMRGVCPREFSPGSRLSLAILLPGLGTEPLLVKGDIVWCRFRSDSGYYEIGIQFLSVAPDAQAALDRFLQESLL